MPDIIQADAGAITQITAVATDTTLQAANNLRKGVSIHNDSTAVLYVALANVTASSTNYTARLASQDHYEVPYGYRGVVKGIWASATGNAYVTEYT